MLHRALCHASVLALLVVAGPLWAAQTTITVSDMHCPSCAKKMTAQLQQVPGVAIIQANVPVGTLTVAPREPQTPSPRALWEAIEKAGFKPAKLEGPGGTFTAKPQA